MGRETGDPNVIIAVLDTGAAFEDYGVFDRRRIWPRRISCRATIS